MSLTDPPWPLEDNHLRQAHDEVAFSKLKAFLKKAAARTKDDLRDTVAQAIDTFTPAEGQNYFDAAGYDLE